MSSAATFVPDPVFSSLPSVSTARRPQRRKLIIDELAAAWRNGRLRRHWAILACARRPTGKGNEPISAITQMSFDKKGNERWT